MELSILDAELANIAESRRLIDLKKASVEKIGDALLNDCSAQNEPNEPLSVSWNSKLNSRQITKGSLSIKTAS
jgi:hypothetical protein